MLKIASSDFVIKNEMEGEESKIQFRSDKYNFMNYLEYVNVGYVLINSCSSVIKHNRILYNYYSNNTINTNNSFNFLEISRLTGQVNNQKSISLEEDLALSNKSSFISNYTEKKIISFFEELFRNLIEIEEYFFPELSIISENNNQITKYLNSETSSKSEFKYNVLLLSEFLDRIKHKLNEEFFFTIGVSKFMHHQQIKYLEIKMRIMKLENKDPFFEILTQDVTKIIEAKIMKEQMTYKSLGLAKVAHDFKNPILSLISLLPTECQSDSDSYISSADDDEENSKEKSFLRKKSTFSKVNSMLLDGNITHRNNLMKNFCSYMLMLIEDFNVYAKMDVEKKKEKPSTFIEKFPNGEVEIRPILEFCVNIFKIRQFNEKDKQKIDIKLVVEENVPKNIIVNETKLKQVLLNIISNAYKFTISGKIIVNAKVFYDEELKKFFRISIQDTGVGISKEDQLTLFSPFKMIDNSKKLNKHGSGLGLLIIKEILQKINSTIEFISEPGLGSTFWFDIPIKSAINKFCTKITSSDLEATSFIDQNFVFTESLTNLFKSLNKNLTISGDYKHLGNLGAESNSNEFELEHQMQQQNVKIQINPTNSKEHKFNNNHLNINIRENSSKTKNSKKFENGRNKSRKETLILTKKEFQDEKLKSKSLIRFVICDDEEIPKIAAQKMIINICKEKMIDYDITFAKNGIECLYILHQKSYKNEAVDILLIDDNMSVMNGGMTIKILNDLIKEKQMPKLSKFIVTSQDDSTNKKVLMQNGCDEVFSKPISKDKILHILRDF